MVLVDWSRFFMQCRDNNTPSVYWGVLLQRFPLRVGTTDKCLENVSIADFMFIKRDEGSVITYSNSFGKIQTDFGNGHHLASETLYFNRTVNDKNFQISSSKI